MSRHAQQLHGSETEDTGSEGAADEDGSSDPAASGEDGPHTTGGRSARAGRSLRNNIRKPPPQVSFVTDRDVCNSHTQLLHSGLQPTAAVRQSLPAAVPGAFHAQLLAVCVCALFFCST